MASIRAKLTTYYAAALVGTMTVFGAALWTARGANVDREVQRYVFAQADIALRVLRQAAAGGEPILEVRDSLVGPTLARRVATALDVLPDYLLVLDTGGRMLYASPKARRLETRDLDVLTEAARRLTSSRVGAIVSLTSDQLLVAGRDELEPSLLPVERVVAGASTSPTALSRRELLGTMVAIAPFILAASIVGAYLIAGRAFRPVDRIINEVEAITDGRSLHRRLPVDEAGDELARLSLTLNEMIARLESSFGALRRFTADASHELKTPLTVLRADVERAMNTNYTSTEQLVALEEALQETTRMADLVDSLLTLARADEGRFDLHRELVPLEPLVREVFETVLILGEDAGLSVTMPVVEPVTVLGDRLRLRQLFLNLVTNAIKYTPRGGRVEVTLDRRGDAAAFSVRDTGIGIAAADLPYIFERFWRADRARSRRIPTADGRWVDERGGFGLGLAISQYIAQAHGGSLAVQSRLGRGSTFTVTLPLAATDEPVIPPAATDAA
jgi:two-component system, OmpR family, sensor kinase